LGSWASVLEAAAPPTQLSFKATKAMTVAQATLAAYACKQAYSGRLFTKVGSLAGNLQYLVNNALVLQPATIRQVKKDDTITWRKV
jgi:hypothetical protein